ncbi:hypothetical protein B0H14DRAFT_3427477 [Mycena olivaceomarginata]|nr:hypothetical protein B0H14DRAFT_3427477 [Mycena olivaceomarginata]
MLLQHPHLCLAKPCLPYLVRLWKLSAPSRNMLLASPNMSSEQRVKSVKDAVNPLPVRSLGVGASVDKEEHIARAHAHADPPVPWFLIQPLLPKGKGKRCAHQITPLPDSDDEVIIVEDPATSSRRRRRYSGSDDVGVVSPVPSRRPKRPHLTISTRTDSPVPSLTSSTSASSSILSTPSSPDFPAALLPTLYSYKSHH